MVYYDHDRVMAVGDRKISDEVDGELPAKEGSGRRDRHEWRDCEVSINLALLTNSAVVHEVFDKRSKTGPPKVTFKDRFGVEDTHVPGCRGEMDQVEEERPCR